MRAKTRFNIVLILGLLFWALIIHNLYGLHFRIAINERSPSHLWNMIPGNPVLVIIVGLIAALVFFGFVAVMNRRVLPEPFRRRRRKPGHRFVTALFGLLMLVVGCYLVWSYPNPPRPQEISGAVAVVVGMSLFLFTFVVTKRKQIVSNLVLILTAAVVVILIQLAPGHREKTQEIKRCLEMALRNLDEQQQRLSAPAPSRAIGQAADRARENLVYRFDDHLEEILDADAPEFNPGEASGHLVAPDAKFAATGYEAVDDEVRRVMFVAASCTLTYKVTVPEENPRVFFGVAATDPRIPTTFEIAVRHLMRRRTIYSKTITGEPAWSDHWLDLSRWKGQRVDVIFRTYADMRTMGLWSSPVMVAARPKMPNVVIFLNDALRADHLGAYGYAGGTSPFFDRLTADGTLFEWAFANATKTRHSIPVLFSSNPISSIGVRNKGDTLPGEVTTIAEVLRALGYATAAFTASANTGLYTGTHQGFSTLLTPQRFARRPAGGGTGADGGFVPDVEELLGDLLDTWLDRNADRSFFLYVHTMDSHRPYDPPERYRRFYKKTDSDTPVRWDGAYDTPWLKSATRESRLGLYDGEIAYGDDYLRHFFDKLEERGLADSTLFVFLSDHGEYFGEHGLWGHGPPAFVQGTHIPLLIIGPGFPAGVRIEEKVQILDVMPTVLDVVDIEPDPLRVHGESLRPTAQGKSSPEIAARTLFMEGDHQGDLSFHCGRFHMFPEKNIIFDLSDDPDEVSPVNEFVLDAGLKSLSREVARRYLETYTELRRRLYPTDRNVLKADAETEEQLRSLGYSQ